MRAFNLCLLGFGNVNRALVELLRRKDGELQQRYGVSWKIAGVASRRIGWLANPQGIDVDRLSRGDFTSSEGIPFQQLSNVADWLQLAGADVLFEATSLNVESGQP